MRQPGRQEACRVPEVRRKKLTGAFRYSLEREGQDQWLAKLAAELPDELPARSIPRRPPEADQAKWHEFYLHAWSALRFDRAYGALGGETPIPFVAYDAYARRYGVEGEAFETFHFFMTALDTEWLEHRRIEAERQKARQKKP